MDQRTIHVLHCSFKFFKQDLHDLLVCLEAARMKLSIILAVKENSKCSPCLQGDCHEIVAKDRFATFA